MKQSNLLPSYYRFVGLAIAITAFLLPVLLGITMEKSSGIPEIWREILRTVILMGLLVAILSREKTEDEFIANCRLRAAVTAFIFGIVIYIASIFMSLNNIGNIYSAFRVILSQSVYYLIMFNLYKRGNLVKND